MGLQVKAFKQMDPSMKRMLKIKKYMNCINAPTPAEKQSKEENKKTPSIYKISVQA